MITSSTIRSDQFGPVGLPIVRVVPAETAFELLLLFEFGYGATVVDLCPTKVVVQTRMFGQVDVTEFSGPESEMELLVEASACQEQTNPLSDQAPAAFRTAVLEQIMKKTGGNPFLISNGAGIISGTAGVKMTLLALLLVDQADSELVSSIVAKKCRPKDLVSLVLLVRRDGAPLASAIELL